MQKCEEKMEAGTEKLKRIRQVMADLGSELTPFIVEEIVRLREETENDERVLHALARRTPTTMHVSALRRIEKILDE